MKNNLKKLISAFRYIIMSYSYFPGKNYGFTRGSYSLAVPLRNRPKKRPVGRPKKKTTNQLRPKTMIGRSSRTMTKTKYRSTAGKVKKTGNNSSVSYTNYGKYTKLNKSIWAKTTGHSIRELMASGSSISTQGTQQLFSPNLFPKSDLDQLKLDANSNVATGNDVTMLLKKAKLKVHFKNQSNVMSHVSIYDVCTINPGFVTAIDSPSEAWDYGFNDMGTPSQSSVIGATPYGSAEFRKLFRITKVTKLKMEPGEEHEHVVKKNMNWIVHSTKWDNQTTANVKGLTYFCLVVFHGSLAHDTANPSSVTYAPVRIDFSYRRQYNYAFISNNKPTYNLADALPKTIVDLDFMGEDQDKDLDPTNA